MATGPHRAIPVAHHKTPAGRIKLSLDDLRLVGLWAADCAERALPLFEAIKPRDNRPREAIAAIRLFARGGDRTLQLRNAALAALAAAREVTDPAATAAARAAGFAASLAYTKALANPHHAKHALGPAVYAALAKELAAAHDPRVGDRELRWAIKHSTAVVREIIGRWPPQPATTTRLGSLFHQLNAALRD